METDAPRSAPPGGYDEQRYNPAMRRVWPWPALLLESVAGWMQALPGRVWLDGACGEGHLGRLIGTSKCLVGLEIDPQRLTLAQGRPYRLLLQGSLAAIPLADASLHGIASVETLEHVSHLDRVLKECARCLCGGGYMIVTVPSVTLRSWWQMRQTGHPVYCSEREHLRELSSVPIRGFPHMFETWKEFERRFEGHGFAIVRTGGLGFLFPMWTGRLAWVERGMNLLYRESCNSWVGRLPIVRRFPYYRIYLLRRREAP
ncbi:MAG: class I SAM-dependent methyltransferase [Nitrospira sp.]|nr:class I SAM-dependent methyltransferase [Nitrospira sp.]